MNKLVLALFVLLVSVNAVSAQDNFLSPLVVQQVDRVGGNAYLQSPDLIRTGVGDRLAALGWPKYTVLPSGSTYTGLYINYSLFVLERTEQSGNGWQTTPLQYFPELSRFWASYSQNAYDTRTHYVAGIEVWGIADQAYGNGRIEIARARGGSAAAFNFVPFQGGSSWVGVTGGSHSSYHSSSMSNPMPIQERQLLEEAVGRMMTQLDGKLRQRSCVFPSIAQSTTAVPPPGRGGPPDLTNQPGIALPDGVSRWYYEKSFTPDQIKRYRTCRGVMIWQQLPDGTYCKREAVAREHVTFKQSTIALRRVTSEAPQEYLEFQH